VGGGGESGVVLPDVHACACRRVVLVGLGRGGCAAAGGGEADELGEGGGAWLLLVMVVLG